MKKNDASYTNPTLLSRLRHNFTTAISIYIQIIERKYPSMLEPQTIWHVLQMTVLNKNRI